MFHFVTRIKEKIRNRDDYICQFCGISQEKFIEKLSIHHINYNKKNNNMSNLISLCNSCHMKTNFNRCYWKKFFGVKINGNTNN